MFFSLEYHLILLVVVLKHVLVVLGHVSHHLGCTIRFVNWGYLSVSSDCLCEEVMNWDDALAFVKLLNLRNDDEIFKTNLAITFR